MGKLIAGAPVIVILLFSGVLPGMQSFGMGLIVIGLTIWLVRTSNLNLDHKSSD